jgi:hypothetical protein
MRITMHDTIGRALALSATAASLAACSADAPIAPTAPIAPVATSLRAPASFAVAASAVPDTTRLVATLRRVTDRYHDIDVARAEGFVLLHDCESRPGEGPVGTVYINMGRLLDGKITGEWPDALIYEPQREGRLQLVGAEFAIPYALAPGQKPPTLLGATFQDEAEFGVFALHAWVWRSNPNGLFAETNPRVSCLTS